MIGILGGMGTQAGLDFCNKLAKLNRGKSDQNYPIFLLYNKSNNNPNSSKFEKRLLILFSLKELIYSFYSEIKSTIHLSVVSSCFVLFIKNISYI